METAPQVRLNIFKQIHEIIFHGKGGYDYVTIYNMPIWLRKFTFKEIKDIDVSLTGDGDRFISAFPAISHYSSSPVDSRLGELARGLGVSTGTHQDQASSKFERIEPFEEMSHSSIHDYTFSVEDLADLSYASRARMMTHGRWPGVKASIVTDPNEESFV